VQLEQVVTGAVVRFAIMRKREEKKRYSFSHLITSKSHKILDVD
jgi:hypothetical protein